MKPRFTRYVALKGSQKKKPDVKELKAAARAAVSQDIITVSLRIRPKEPIPDPLQQTKPRTTKALSREAFHSRYAASEDDLQLIAEFAHACALSVVKTDAATRMVELRGTLPQMEKAFQVKLGHYQDENGTVFRGREGAIHIPSELKGVVEGVFGLDDRAATTPKFKILGTGKSKTGLKFQPAKRVQTSFNPNQLVDIYNYPKEVKGTGQCIAIIELGGGYRTEDINNYFKELKIPVPKVVAVSVDGAHNAPSTANSADGEVMLDIEVAGAVAPGATLAVYFAPNTDKGFLDAITQAVHDTRYKPGVISISWGAAESQWTQQSLDAYNQVFKEAASLGVTICAAAGDAGSNDGVTDGKAHVDFPASSPYVLACGGTRLSVGTNGKIASEVVWHESDDSATGGGISEVFALPDYQAKAKVPVSVNNKKAGRGLPDVAAVADPATGYNILVDGHRMVIGGTSAVAPLMAGLLALINEKLKKQVGFIHPRLYAKPAVCRDITEGDNITVKGNKGYKAVQGWDACTGNGVPDGVQLLGIL